MVFWNLSCILCPCPSAAWEVRLKDGATAVRGEWKWSTKENGAQWMTRIEAWKRQLWCAENWSVELPLMLPEGLILDQGFAPFGFTTFTAMGQNHHSWSVVILLLKTIVLRAFPIKGMPKQSAQVRPVWSGRGCPAGKVSMSFWK